MALLNCWLLSKILRFMSSKGSGVSLACPCASRDKKLGPDASGGAEAHPAMDIARHRTAPLGASRPIQCTQASPRWRQAVARRSLPANPLARPNDPLQYTP